MTPQLPSHQRELRLRLHVFCLPNWLLRIAFLPWWRTFNLRVPQHLSRGLLFLTCTWALCTPALSLRAQSTNTPPPQDAITPSTQTTNTLAPQFPVNPSLQYSNPPSALYPGPQSALETNVPPEELPPAIQASTLPRLNGTSQLATPTPVPLQSVPPVLRWGPLTAQTHVFYRLSYADGLQPFPGEQSRSIINELDPGLLLQLGSHWTLDYTPSLRSYSSSAFRDTFDNSVAFTGQTAYEDWTFALSQNYASSSDPLIETGTQLGQQTYVTVLNATRQLGSQTSLQLGANQNFRFLDNTFPAEQLSDSRSWSTLDWLNYQFWPRLGAAIGAGFGYDSVQVGADMTSEQLQGRLTWTVVQKLSFVLSGGAEDRQFLGTDAPNLISPIFSFSAVYSPFEVTTFFVGASRTVSPSFFQDQITEGTSISAGVRQRLLGKLFVDLSGGYASSTYHASTTTPAFGIANYNSTFFSARLSAALLQRGIISVFYSANYNSSVSAFYNYTTTQVGMELTYRY